MTAGTVKWFDAVTGYGFITPDGGDEDVIVHRTSVEAADMVPLTEGQRISFEILDDMRGLKAANLVPAE